MRTPTTNAAPLTPHRAVVDLRLDSDGSLRIVWHDAPDMAGRVVSLAHVRRLLATMDAVHDAEQTPDAARLRAAWLAASLELVSLLDGPEQALHDRIEHAEREGRRLVVIVRALAAHQDALRHHPATRVLWQLLPHADAEAHGRRRFSAVLQLGSREPGEPWVLPHAGLRILFMAFSPRHVVPVLDHEHEEERLLSVLAPFLAGGRASVRIVEDGTLEDLGRALLLDDYDVVHLSGHGIRTPKGPRLAMEDETGQVRLVSPDELIGILQRAAAMPPLVVLSNCHSADARGATPSFAVELVAAGVPMALGWTTPVRDDLATTATSALYEQLAAGKSTPEAVELARDALRQADAGPHPSHTWATLALVSSAASGFRVDRRAPALPPAPQAQETYEFLAEGHMKVMLRGFVGRRRPLQRLVRVLRDGSFADTDDADPRNVVGVVVWGMKGVGKSCLVARAIERARQHDAELRMVVLHGAVDEQELLTALQRALDPSADVDAEQMLSQKDVPVLQRARRVLHLWRRQPVVMVLDDFEQNLELRLDGPARLNNHAAELLDILVPACTRGKLKVLITTTATFEVPASHAAAFCELPLGTLEAASVRKLWMRGPSASVSLGQWEALAVRLGNNARILSWARDLLAGKTSDELTKIAARAAEQLPVWQPGDEVRQEKHDELARLFLCHMAHDDARARVGSDALVFLRRARVYDVAVPAQAFEGLIEGLSIDLERDLVVLANLGLLEVGELDGQRAYRVSPLVERRFAAEQPERWQTIASLFWWKAAQRSNGGVDYHVPRVHRSWRHAVDGRNGELAEQAGAILRRALHHQGRHNENQRCADENLTVFPDAPFSSYWAGDAERLAKGPSARARALLEAAVQKLVTVHGTRQHESIAAVLHALGKVVMDQGHLAEGREILGESIELQKLCHGTDVNLDVVASLQALAELLQDLGDLPGAEANLERALEICSALPDGGNYIPSVLQGLGGLSYGQGKFEAALAAFERALPLQREIYGTDVHPSVAATLHMTGMVLHTIGDLASARRVLERSIAIKEEVTGSETHLGIAATLQVLSGVLRAQGDLRGARETLHRCVAILSASFGAEPHPHMAAALHALTVVLLSMQDYQGARAAITRSLEIQSCVYGTDRHPRVAASLLLLGAVKLQEHDLAGARKVIERARDIHLDVYGPEPHPGVAGALHNLACVCIAERRPLEAVALLRQALEIHERCYGTRDQYHTAETEVILAKTLIAIGQIGEGQRLLDHALPLLVAANPNHPSAQYFARWHEIRVPGTSRRRRRRGPNVRGAAGTGG